MRCSTCAGSGLVDGPNGQPWDCEDCHGRGTVCESCEGDGLARYLYQAVPDLECPDCMGTGKECLLPYDGKEPVELTKLQWGMYFEEDYR